MKVQFYPIRYVISWYVWDLIHILYSCCIFFLKERNTCIFYTKNVAAIEEPFLFNAFLQYCTVVQHITKMLYMSTNRGWHWTKNFGFGTYGNEAGVYNWRFWSGNSDHEVKSVQDQLAILPPETRTCLPHSTGSRRAVSECLLAYLRRFIIQNVHILPADNAVT